MRAATTLTITALTSNDVNQIVMKINEMIGRYDEYFRTMRSDVEIMDFREPPPHPTISHSVWKFQDRGNDNLELWHLQNGIWVATGHRWRG